MQVDLITLAISSCFGHGCRDADIVSLGLTAFASFMGDSGAAAGEPLESFRATAESTGLPDLSALGRQELNIIRINTTSIQFEEK